MKYKFAVGQRVRRAKNDQSPLAHFGTVSSVSANQGTIYNLMEPNSTPPLTVNVLVDGEQAVSGWNIWHWRPVL